MAKQQKAWPQREIEATKEHRKAYSEYDRDCKEYCKAVADFNVGFLAGQDAEREKFPAVLKALDALAVSKTGTWSKSERKLYEKACEVLKCQES